jgi:hypothetical protein
MARIPTLGAPPAGNATHKNLRQRIFFCLTKKQKDFYSCASVTMPAMAWVVEAAET